MDQEAIAIANQIKAAIKKLEEANALLDSPFPLFIDYTRHIDEAIKDLKMELEELTSVESK